MLVYVGERLHFTSSVPKKEPLSNLEDEIFFKGGSVVTPQNFDLVLLIKILPGNLIFIFGIYLLVAEPPFSWILWSLSPK